MWKLCFVVVVDGRGHSSHGCNGMTTMTMVGSNDGDKSNGYVVRVMAVVAIVDVEVVGRKVFVVVVAIRASNCLLP